ncbi:MAG: PH domain-containing protein [Candidatus Saccharibacteria bacterium]
MSLNKLDTIEAISPNETKLEEIRRHWFGLAIVYFEVVVGLVAATALFWFIAPNMFNSGDTSQHGALILILITAAAIISWLILVLYTYIYRQSKILVSNKNLTVIVQKGLFNRQVSELSMADVEDVSAAKQGFFPSVLNYGDLLVETAGESQNFKFSYCPRPDYCGKVVLDAREKFIGTNTK